MGAKGRAGRFRRTPGPLSLLRFGFRRVALRLAHFQEPLAVAGVRALEGVVGALAREVALTGIDTLALHLPLGRAGSAHRHGREHHRGSRGQGNTGQDSGIHFCVLLERIGAAPIVAPAPEDSFSRVDDVSVSTQTQFHPKGAQATRLNSRPGKVTLDCSLIHTPSPAAPAACTALIRTRPDTLQSPQPAPACRSPRPTTKPD